jgi:hypothetical protein
MGQKGSIMQIETEQIVENVQVVENTDGILVVAITVSNSGPGIQAVMIAFDMAREDPGNNFLLYHEFLVQAGLDMEQTILLPSYAGMHWSWDLDPLSGAGITASVARHVTLHMPYTN